MARKRQILVIGNNDDGCTPEVENPSPSLFSNIAKSNSVLITGGLGGVMRAASRGAHDTGGLTVGIIPQNDFSLANEFCDIVIPTGIGLMRDFLNALSADGVIVIGGGSGTLSEICAAYMYKKPIIALKNSGGTASKYANQFLDHRKNVQIIGVETVDDAMKCVLEQINT